VNRFIEISLFPSDMPAKLFDSSASPRAGWLKPLQLPEGQDKPSIGWVGIPPHETAAAP